jgi:hypothetical protein
MKIHSPSFSGSVSQADSAYSDLSGSFTGSFLGTFTGDLNVEEATFERLRVTEYAAISSSLSVTGSIYVTEGSVFVEGVDVLDTALAYAIALG